VSTRKPPTPRQRLEALVEHKLRRLEAEAKKGKLPSTAELNGARRLVDSLEASREQDEQLERWNSLTRR
jgi:hypothetical protein